MAYNARNLLTIGQPSFMENWICPAPFDETSSPDIKRQKMLMKFKEQMYRYNYHAPQKAELVSLGKLMLMGNFLLFSKTMSLFVYVGIYISYNCFVNIVCQVNHLAWSEKK